MAQISTGNLVPTTTIVVILKALCILTCLCGICAEYIPPGPLYRCPKDKLLLHPCSCDSESDQGLYVTCNNTNLASMSVALNNLATYQIPIEKLTIYKCNFARLYGSLLYKLVLRVLEIRETPIQTIDEHTFLGVNNTLNELHLLNSSLKEFPTLAFKHLGNLTVLNIDGHQMALLPNDAFSQSSMSGKLLKLHIVNGNLTTPTVESLQPLRKLKTLDLHGNQMKELKRNQFKGLRDVEVLDISHNLIGKVDASHLADLTKMSWFNASHNKLTELTRGAFARNAVLKVLNLSHNQIKKLDSTSFRGMRFLRRLYLSDNAISDVGRGTFGTLQRIGTIDLARNFITKIDYQMFFQLNFIEKIDVSENQVKVIEKLAFKDVYYTDINLSKNNISKIEVEAFVNCANITKLDLSFNNLSSLPKRAFDETTYATELQISHNFFTELNQIPLQNMTGIKILNASHNNISKIPKNTFPKLYELHTIDLAHNNISDIFNAVFQVLFSLRQLDLSHNSLDTIKPGTFGPLPTLLRLDLSHNGMHTIAKSSLTRLASTRELILKGNKLNSLFLLPISVSHLDLSQNEFEEIPTKSWPSMNSLLSLDLSHNKLEDRLEKGSFSNLLTLQKLNLNYNGMTQPPWAAISELTALQYIYMEGNSLTKLDRNAFGRLPVVFELNLANNNINNVSVKAFEGLLQVITLNLTNNNITHIPNGAFHGLVALQTLDLSHNKITKLDNKTHSILDDCLSLERLNLSHNKISFLSRKSFPSNPYIPYKLKEIDLSFNIMPIISFDLVFGTSKLQKLNVSHNAITDIRKGVIGNLTQLHTIDLSYNKLQDLISDEEFFRLPPNITTIYISNNQLHDLPWQHLINVSRLSLLDIRHNLIDTFGTQLTRIAANGTRILFEGNPLRCDCLLRPLKRYFENQLFLPPFYQRIQCQSPPYLANLTLFDLPEDRLNCPANVNTTRIMEMQPGDFQITPDLRFRELSMKKNKVLVKWRVMKNAADIADTYVFIRNIKKPQQELIYETVLPYFKRSLEIDAVANNLTGRKRSSGSLSTKADTSGYEICLLAKNSQSSVRAFYAEQCQDLSKTIKSAANVNKIDSRNLFLAITAGLLFFNIRV